MIFEKLKKIIEKVYPDIDISKVTLDTDLRDDLGMDSLGLMMVSMEIEDTFGIHFNKPVDFKTASDVCSYLKEEFSIQDN